MPKNILIINAEPMVTDFLVNKKFIINSI